MRWLTVFLPFFVLASPLRADFSAVQTSRMQVGERETPAQRLTVYQKGKKTRYDISESITVILDEETKRRITVDRAKKVYQVADWEPVPENPMVGKITIAPTERRTTIAGHSVRLYLWKASLGDIQIDAEIWCATDLPRVALPSIVGGGFDPASQNKGMDGHPFRVTLVTKQKGGLSGILTSQISAASTRELPESYFAPPAGFTEEKKAP